MEEDKRKHLFSNSVYAVKTIFKYAPIVSSIYTVTALTSGFFTPISIYCLQKLIDGVFAYMSHMYDMQKVAMWGGFYVFSLFGIELFWFVQPKMDRFMNRKLRNSLSPAVIEKFMCVEYHYFEEQNFKDVVSRVGNRPQQYIIYVTYLDLIILIQQLIRLIGILALFFVASFWIGIGAAFIGIPIVILESSFTDKKQRLLRDATSDQRMGEYLQNLFSDKNSAYEIKIFGAKNYLLDLWHEVMGKIFIRYAQITKTNLQIATIISLLKIAYTSFAVVTLILGFISGNIGLGILISVIGAISTLFGIIGGLSSTFAELVSCAFHVNYFKEFMSYGEREKKDSINNNTLVSQLTGIKNNMDIVFDHVTFTYPNTKREILHNVSFTIKSGEKAAIVGVNGAGKSTIIKLLCGLYKPNSGHIYIGDKDINMFSQEEIQKVVSVVFQDYGCYQMSLRENIAFGDLSAINDDKRLAMALRMAGADEILAKGLDINLGHLADDGVDISKGQWQRIAVARAFLSKAHYVILDEPTASLDPIAESHMYEAFSKILSKRGTIIISHRLASAKMADKIIVIDGGEVASIGNHFELMTEGGIYAVMFEEQSSWYRQEEQNEEAMV